MRATLLRSLFFVGIASSCFAASLEESVSELTRVGREGSGNETASRAWKETVAAGPRALTLLLQHTGTTEGVAGNWLRLAADAIVERAIRDKAPLPVDMLESLVRTTTNPDASRVLAFDLLLQCDRGRAEELERTLTEDPVQSLRRGAVAHVIASAKAVQNDASRKKWEEALRVVRDEDQTKTVVEALRGMGVNVDLPRHFGFITRWHLIAPFDNSSGAGFQTAFAPETDSDLSKQHAGKEKTVHWQKFDSTDEYGKIDFNKAFTTLKGAAGYAVTRFESASERDAELRLGCKNAWKVWLNGRLLFGRDEYHRGQRMDQYKLKCRLQKGTNTILVKCCQNEQTETWAAEWEFQLRVCDSTGTAILSTDNLTDTPPAAKPHPGATPNPTR